MIVYSMTKVNFSIMEESTTLTKVFNSKEVAKHYLNEEVEKLKKQMIAMNEDDETFDIEEWEKESLIYNIDNDDYIYKHYIYNGEEEKIIELRKHEI